MMQLKPNLSRRATSVREARYDEFIFETRNLVALFSHDKDFIAMGLKTLDSLRKCRYVGDFGHF